MQVDQVIDSLAELNVKRGKLACVEVQISELEQMIRSGYASLVSDQVLTGKGQDDMPHGSGVSRLVENLAIRLADGWVPAELKDADEELKLLYRERDALRLEVARMEAWLRALNDRQRFVVERQIIQQESWRAVTTAFRERFGEAISKDTLKRIKTRACEIIRDMTE